MYPYIMTDESITLLLDGKPNVVASTHPNFTKIIDAVKTSNWPAIPDMIDIPAAIRRYADGELEVWDNEVRFQGEPLSNAATERLLAMMAQGFNVAPMVSFLNRVVNNPDRRAVEGLYSWLERGNLPLSPDGFILAYKLIRHDYLDHYTGKIDHSVGKVVTMPRFKCDPDPDRTCSSGLHFCSAAYLPHYGSRDSRVVLVKIDPADVVAFPHDYNISKGRCCRYEVIEEIERETAATFFGDKAIYSTPKTEPAADQSEFGFTVDAHGQVFDEDSDLCFTVSAKGIANVAGWFNLEGLSDGPYAAPLDDEDFTPALLRVFNDRLFYDDVEIVEFDDTNSGILAADLEPGDFPFQISVEHRTIRVRD